MASSRRRHHFSAFSAGEIGLPGWQDIGDWSFKSRTVIQLVEVLVVIYTFEPNIRFNRASAS